MRVGGRRLGAEVCPTALAVGQGGTSGEGRHERGGGLYGRRVLRQIGEQRGQARRVPLHAEVTVQAIAERVPRRDTDHSVRGVRQLHVNGEGHARPGRAGVGRIGQRGLGGLPPEDETFEQGVRGEAVRALHAGAGGLPRHVEPGHVGAPGAIGADAAHAVVRGGRDRQEVAREIEPPGAEVRGDVREALVDKRRIEPAQR